MDQITVSDIPLPGEEFPLKNDEKPESINEETENLKSVIEVKEIITEDTNKVTEDILQDACKVISEAEVENDENIRLEITENEEICETPMTEEVTIETIEEIVEESTQPAKVSRSNSTIEAIKNDWSDGLTIEEVNDDTIKSNSPIVEPIITEPDKNVEEIETAAVIVVETVEEDLIGENVTIEIIDNSEMEDSKEEDKIDNLLLLSEVIDNPSENEVKQLVEKEAKVKQTVEEEANVKQTVENEAIIEQIVEEGANVKQTLEEGAQMKQIVGKEAKVKQIVEEAKVKQIVEKEVKVKQTVEKEVKLKQTVEEGAKMKQIVEEGAKMKQIVEEESKVKQTVAEGAKVKQMVEKEAKVKQTVEEDAKVKQVAEKEAIMEQIVEEGKIKKPRGRPPKNTVQRSDNLHIPCHVLGRNVDNPTEDLISNGRTPPKPRLGVKVPYRFLTSQIVSKEEIANELVELTNKRNPDPDPPAGGDIFFASKLTQRLANKIASNTKKKQQIESTSGIPNDALTSSTQETTAQTNQNTIGDNKDLLAILEGDVDVDWTKEVSKTSENGSKTEEKSKKGLDPEMERQIALKQLRELPKIKHSGRGRPRKYNFEPINKKLPETSENIKEVDKTKENIEKELDIDDNDLNLTPKPVTKTYSRKETVLNLPDDLEIIVNDSELNRALQDDPEDKKIEENKQEEEKIQENKKIQEKSEDKKPERKEEEGKPDKTKAIKKQKRTSTEINKSEITLVSKRARIIKKKVIWDPAEIPKTKVLNAIRRAQAQEMRARKKMNKTKSGDETSDDDEEETKETQKEQKETREVQKKPETKDDQKKQETKDDQKEQQQEVKKNKKIITDDEEEIKEKQNKEVKQLRKRLVPRKSLTKVQKKKLLITRPLRSLTGKLIRSTTELKSSLTLSKKKKQVMAEIAKSVRNKPKKTELDKLLGDEGAVNMLYSVKNKGKAPPKTYLTQKEIQNRKKQLRDVITQSSQEDKTKALRKKESPVPVQLPARKKSRDSTRSSLQSPPPSPSFYSHRAEASRIIRRHSSSFSSDCSSPRRLSVDQNKVETETNDFPTPARVLRRKPEDKSKNDKEKLSQTEKRKLNVEMSKNFDKIPKKRTRSSKGEEGDIEGDKTVENKTKSKLTVVPTEYKELILKKLNNFYQITMNPPTNAKLRDVISLQMFQELNTLLTKLSKDDNCKIVLLNSNGKSFCNGLDFSHLIQSTAEKRITAAQEMSKALKNFILTIAKFPKPILVSLHSHASLFGCTMLPYFDVVIAVDSAVLTADYSRVGHSPEGGAHLTLAPKTATDLLILGKKLTAKEAMKDGLINVVESKEKYEETVMKIVGEMSEKSVQSLIATKFLLRQSLLQKLDAALEIEQKHLLEFWPNSECQQLFKKLATEQDLW